MRRHVPTNTATNKQPKSGVGDRTLRDSAQSIDDHVGQRLRQRRQELNLSQTVVADQLGVTFQQVQKYERGMNRISASRLHDLCAILSVPVEYFFDGLDEVSGEVEGPDLSDPELAALIDAYSSIPRQTTRTKLSAMLRAVARWSAEETAS